MENKKDILVEAINSLFKYTKIQAIVKRGSAEVEGLLVIGNKTFAFEVKSEVTKGNKGLILASLKKISKDNNLPVLLISKYIPTEIAKEYIAEGVNYLDVSGNCNIRQHDLFLQIEGKKVERFVRAHSLRTFQEAGIRLIFQFLVDPEKTQLPYRELAEMANISLGSVGTVMQGLIEQNFLLKTKQSKKLKNTKELLNRWIIAYHDVLRPRLLKKKMRFINPEIYNHWKELNLVQPNGFAYWGGEPGANLLTGYLHPGVFTIYTDYNWQSFKDIKLIPDENGDVEILELFWNPEACNGLPPVLIYADLMSSGSDRNVETAKMILENELQYIQ